MWDSRVRSMKLIHYHDCSDIVQTVFEFMFSQVTKTEGELGDEFNAFGTVVFINNARRWSQKF